MSKQLCIKAHTYRYDIDGIVLFYTPEDGVIFNPKNVELTPNRILKLEKAIEEIIKMETYNE